MKKKIAVVLLLGIILIAMTGCQCRHEWQDATCGTPKTCTKCGETEGSPLGHEWTDATCILPKTCTLCGVTEGKALGHDWEDATCEQPKTCRVCGEQEGDPIPHTVNEWTTTVDPTCTSVGKAEGVCQICGQTVTEDIPMTECTPGDWEVTKDATESTPGKRERKCTVCGKVIESEEFTLTPEEIKAAYIAKCGNYTYQEISRNPGEYKGEYAKFSGQVIQVMQDTYGSMVAYTLRVNVSGYNTTVYVTYYASSDDPRILDKDRITMYGMLAGEKTYTTVMGDSITIPKFEAEYIDIR